MDFIIFILAILGALYAPIFTLGIFMLLAYMPLTGCVLIVISLIKSYIDKLPTKDDE